ncbi:MAG: AtpZ/AtpI family protein [Epulopiscium sp.]|nr:AtpZ/AtpI family protein [Candidatus Epulonipiscium sp.]
MKKGADVFKLLSLITHLGLVMVIPIIGCIWFGSFLDKKLNTSVFFLIIFTILGIFSAFRNLFVVTQQALKKSDSKRREDE